MKVLDRIDEKLNEGDMPSFAKGKDVKYLGEYLVKLADYWKRAMKTAERTGDYGSRVNTLVSSGLGDLNRMKKQLDHMAKTGKVD